MTDLNPHATPLLIFTSPSASACSSANFSDTTLAQESCRRSVEQKSFTITISSSSEVLVASMVLLKLEEHPPVEGGVGRSKGVAWGLEFVIGRQRQLEDVVAELFED
ncbi:hypothetical protein L6452_26501 [Arctium lappa]|uniref:Uncharacterized protein n=1 Tax=Arctium lappa TaxID=4217 RepID=A0ACB8ZW64_ARCLA|nr:hypothetical protein L6452_26501 [Arctium lappa]